MSERRGGRIRSERGVVALRSVFLLALVLLALPARGQDVSSNLDGRTIKDIRLEGLKRTKAFVVTRELISRVGEPYREANIAKERSRLEQLDIFADIRIDAAAEGEDVVLTYHCVEMLSFLPSLSVQVTDENGIVAGVGAKVPNLFGRDVSFSGRVMGGGAGLIQVALRNPWFAGNRIGLNLEYHYRDRENLIGDFIEISHEFLADVSTPLGENGRIGGTLEYVNIRSDREGVTLSPDNQDQVTRIGAYLRYDLRDAFLGTGRGWWAELKVGREVRLFRNASDFYQLDLDIRRYQPLPFGDRHTLSVYSLLTLRTGTVGEDIAPWQQFGMGGTNTVRGWDYASQIGKNQFIGTMEYAFTLLEPRMITLPLNIRYRAGLQVCLFGDLGTAWNEPRQFGPGDFLGGYGVGIRFLVPVVGMARVDFGWGQKGKGVSIHLGAYEKPIMARRRVR